MLTRLEFNGDGRQHVSASTADLDLRSDLLSTARGRDAPDASPIHFSLSFAREQLLLVPCTSACSQLYGVRANEAHDASACPSCPGTAVRQGPHAIKSDHKSFQSSRACSNQRWDHGNRRLPNANPATCLLFATPFLCICSAPLLWISMRAEGSGKLLHRNLLWHVRY